MNNSKALDLRIDAKHDTTFVLEMMYLQRVTYRTHAKVIEALSRLNFFVEQTGIVCLVGKSTSHSRYLCTSLYSEWQ